MRTRRRFSAEFKAKVALEAIKDHPTVAELLPATTTRWHMDAAISGLFYHQKKPGQVTSGKHPPSSPQPPVPKNS